MVGGRRGTRWINDYTGKGEERMKKLVFTILMGGSKTYCLIDSNVEVN